MKSKSTRSAKRPADPKIPPVHDWRTTDEDEVNRRRARALDEQPRIENADRAERIFSNFHIHSPSGVRYQVEIHDLAARGFSCNCVDFRINGLGTCKHVEAVLLHLEARHQKLFAQAVREGSLRIDVLPELSAGTLRIARGLSRLPARLRRLFDRNGLLLSEEPEQVVKILRAARIPQLRVSQEVDAWLENRRIAEERLRLHREYEEKVQASDFPTHETLVPLFPYQREGMLHLAFKERALLADEMGLGKTIQAIAACALLHRLGKAHRALIVTPASLKTEWEEQIQKFTRLPYQLVFGRHSQRIAAYDHAPFFTLVNYEQMLTDALDVNARLKPDIVVLDEAQRIKNWNTKTAQAIKRLQSRYAFVLTGTPIENRIDELYSIIGFLDPSVFGPLFRFNREFYQLDDRGRPEGYRNLEQLRERVRPLMLRRRKAEVETELPSRSDRNHFVELGDSQQTAYDEHFMRVSKLTSIAKRRPLTKQEQDKLMRELAMMRMVCDTNYILDPSDRACPKLSELETILEECCADPDVKVIIFSEWERMLELVTGLCRRLKLGFAWHTGSVPQQRRRAEIQMFKTDPNCRVFLSTDSGGVGLNLQNASVVINCDLPWNPAKLEQRIARAWRKHQLRNVTVVNLISRDTIEHRMLDTLQVKQGLSEGVLDGRGDLSQIKMRGGAQAFVSRLDQVIDTRTASNKPHTAEPPQPTDRAAAFSAGAAQMLGGKLVECAERFPLRHSHSTILVVVERDAELHRGQLEHLHAQLFSGIDPLAPVHLEVIDRATADVLKRLTDSGLITGSIRATRHLYPPITESLNPLSPEEQQRITARREQSVRKLKMARLLAAGDLEVEARAALHDAICLAAQALAIESRLPEPSDLTAAFRPPLSLAWGDSLPTLRGFAEGGDLQTALDALSGRANLSLG